MRRRRWSGSFKREDNPQRCTNFCARRPFGRVLLWLPRGRLATLLLAASALLAAAFLAVSGAVSTMAGVQRIQEPVCRVETGEKQIALSFDVEWTDVQTGELLSILKKHRVSATFFLVGNWAQAHRDSVVQIAAAGCELGSHSMAHTNMQKLSPEKQKKQLEDCSRVLEEITGKRPRLFRAPYDAYSPGLLAAVREQGMVSIQWDVDSLDWKNLSPERICDHVMEQVRPGSIVRFQSNALNAPTALDELLGLLKEQGYTVVTVSELLEQS